MGSDPADAPGNLKSSGGGGAIGGACVDQGLGNGSPLAIGRCPRPTSSRLTSSRPNPTGTKGLYVYEVRSEGGGSGWLRGAFGPGGSGSPTGTLAEF